MFNLALFTFLITILLLHNFDTLTRIPGSLFILCFGFIISWCFSLSRSNKDSQYFIQYYTILISSNPLSASDNDEILAVDKLALIFKKPIMWICLFVVIVLLVVSFIYLYYYFKTYYICIWPQYKTYLYCSYIFLLFVWFWELYDSILMVLNDKSYEGLTDPINFSFIVSIASVGFLCSILLALHLVIQKIAKYISYYKQNVT